MATLESTTFSSFLHLSKPPKPRSPPLTPATLHFSTHKSLPISRKFQPFFCLSSATPQVEVSVDEEEELDETQKEIQKRKLFVVNLPWSLSDADLTNLFAECGTVADVEIIKWKNGKSRGFAFVTMSSGEEAMAVINKYDSHELMGRVIRVEFAKKLRKSYPPPPERKTEENKTKEP